MSTALETARAVRSAKYSAVTSFIADPEPENDIPNIITRLSAIEDWILNYELNAV